MIELSIPCQDCGCDTVVGLCKKDGLNIRATICLCPDGGNYFDLHIEYLDREKTDEWLKYKSKEEVESFLNSCFTSEVISHHCNPINN